MEPVELYLFSATRQTAPAAVELHGPAAQRHMHRHLCRLLEGGGLAGRHDLAVHCCRLVDVRNDDRIRPYQLVDDESGLARAGHVRCAGDAHHDEVCVVVSPNHKLLLRRDTGITGEIGDQAVAEAQDEPSRGPT